MYSTIVSIWPMEESADRPLFKPARTNQRNDSNHFVLAAGSPEAPSALTIGDFYQEQYLIAGKTVPIPIAAEELANDLLHQWTAAKATNLPPHASPGIFLWAGKPEPTIEEIKASEQFEMAVANQRRFAEHTVQEARFFHSNNRGRNVNELHMRMANMLGIRGEAWQAQRFDTASELCNFCGSAKPKAAPVCANCRNVTDPAKYAQLTGGSFNGPSEISAAFDLKSVGPIGAPKTEPVIDIDALERELELSTMPAQPPPGPVKPAAAAAGKR